MIGKYDALKGLTLLGDGHGNFKHLPLQQSGFVADSDARALARLETKNKQSIFLVSQVLDSIKIFKRNNLNDAKRIYPTRNETYAILNLKGNKKRKLELSLNSGYLSQSSSSVVALPGIESAYFFDSNGNRTRVIKF